MSGSSSREVTQIVSWLPSRLPHRWTFQSRKTLRQIFQILSQEFLVTWCGDLFVTHFSRENRVFCALRIVSKKLFNFPLLTLTIHCLVHSSLSQTHRVLSKNAPFFFFISTSNFKKRYEFSIFVKVFHGYSL